ncbi:hypothetical protein BAE44_0017624 [Dichanthelium oligosanthes]|uniref:Uncharacterized protein n=1 Tax=Dichanthelium oligosanthes TaxID=888268 RepID=A0A1E5V856_9POAL|nr:hypothetical protein BAE44_0017624 [Dichanthelium oligosanthes]
MGGRREMAEPLSSRSCSPGEDGQRPRHAGLHMGDRRRARRFLHRPAPRFLVRDGDSLPRGFQVLITRMSLYCLRSVRGYRSVTAPTRLCISELFSASTNLINGTFGLRDHSDPS